MTEKDKAALAKRVAEDGPNDPFWLERGWTFACEYKQERITELEDENKRLREMIRKVTGLWFDVRLLGTPAITEFNEYMGLLEVLKEESE